MFNILYNKQSSSPYFMTQFLTSISLIFLLLGCCSYDNRSFDFTEEEFNHFSRYKIGDTIYFQSNLGDMDTITIVGFGVEKKDTCGFLMAIPAFNERWIKIKHLPRDDWS